MLKSNLNNTKIFTFCFLLSSLTCFVCADYSDLIHFQLYTQHNRSDYEEIIVRKNYTNLLETNFNVNVSTKIIVHGWMSGSEFEPLVAIKDNYLTKNDYNVIMVDWSRLARDEYGAATASVRIVAAYLARLIVILKINGVQDIHAIGFGLGAHVPGIASNYLKEYKINRITGLDPAKPFFMTVGLEDKLDASDADFVDVYHTEVFIQGKNENCGDVDFFMNWGGIQPGCSCFNIVCSHYRAPFYFAESIISDVGFWGFPMNIFKMMMRDDEWILAGEHIDHKTSGSYYVATNSGSPYAKGRNF